MTVLEQPKRLADEAYEQIESMIVTLVLPPGTVFSEGNLAQRLGFGRTPVREALQRLASDQLVDVLPRRGMRVTEVNLADHLALVETRRVLDRLLVGQAARRATREQRKRLQTCAMTLESAAKDGDTDRFMRDDRACDEIVAQAARNPFAAKACAPLHTHCRRFWYLHRDHADLNRSAARHQALMLAVAAGDVALAEQNSDALVDYLEQFTRAVLDL